MKIIHLCLASFFPDNYSYQENMLPKFHKRLGYDVSVIASLETFDGNGNVTYYEKAKEYINENEILVNRLEYKKPLFIYKRLRRYKGLYKLLIKSAPDIIFIHGCQFLDIDKVVKFLKSNNGISVFVDNHADFSNSAKNFISKNFLHKYIWRKCAQKILPYTQRFYGVLPARVDFLTDVYKIPKSKCELLVMGADDDMVNKASSPEIRKEIRKKYNIDDDDFLIITGGKIDAWKKQTILLMKAINQMHCKKIKLIIFGTVVPELKDVFFSCVDNVSIIYAGWIDSKDTYYYFAASDLAVFPGRHSVLWEQATAQGLPIICKWWSGTDHIDLGGNVKFLYEDSVDIIAQMIYELFNNKKEYERMKSVAVNLGINHFSYQNIALRSISVSKQKEGLK